MPVYEYECQSCRRVHEVLQKFSDLPLARCPECGGEVRKLMSLSSFALKGSGWYVTDYKKTGASAAPAAKSAPAAGEPAPAAKSVAEPKPETKSEKPAGP